MKNEEKVARWLFEREYGEVWEKCLADPRWAGRVQDALRTATELLALIDWPEMNQQAEPVGWIEPVTLEEIPKDRFPMECTISPTRARTHTVAVYTDPPASREPPILHERDEHGNWICCCGDHLPAGSREREALSLEKAAEIIWDTWEEHTANPDVGATPWPDAPREARQACLAVAGAVMDAILSEGGEHGS